MSNGFHVSALMNGIAVAVETQKNFSAELVEKDAASSIRWNGEPPPPQIVVACSYKDRQEHFPIVKATKQMVDDGDLYSSTKKALDRAVSQDLSLTFISERLKRGIVSMPYGSAHITCLPLGDLEKICRILASLAPESGSPMHALYIRVDAEAHRGTCGFDCFGDLTSLVEVNLGMTCQHYLHHRRRDVNNRNFSHPRPFFEIPLRGEFYE
jgi:hypothetical protein